MLHCQILLPSVSRIHLVVDDLRLCPAFVQRGLVVRLRLETLHGVLAVEQECSLFERVAFCLGDEEVDEETNGDDDAVKDEVVFP